MHSSVKKEPLRLITFLFISFSLFLISCTSESSIQSSSEVLKTKVLSQETVNGISCSEGIQNSGALYRICVPLSWNRDLVIYAHGYVSPTEPIALPDLTIDDTTSIEKIITDMGYAFATTSYSKNGLAVKEGMADIADLINIFKNNFGRSRNVYIIGASEGGLIANLSMEKNFSLFSGALSVCGPTGDFAEQINYFGNFRVMFDYFFPGIIPGSAIDIPQEVMDNFETKYVPAILSAVAADPVSAGLVLKTTRAAIDPFDPELSAGETIVGLLWYSVFATNNAQEVLGGQPFDNSQKEYRAGFLSRLINASVPRYTADPAALSEIEQNYQTTGNIFKPLVMMHTFKDPIVPKWQQDLYINKVAEAGNAEFLISKAINRYGHCNFTVPELTAAFSMLVYKVTGELPENRDRKKQFSLYLKN